MQLVLAPLLCRVGPRLPRGQAFHLHLQLSPSWCKHIIKKCTHAATPRWNTEALCLWSNLQCIQAYCNCTLANCALWFCLGPLSALRFLFQPYFHCLALVRSCKHTQLLKLHKYTWHLNNLKQLAWSFWCVCGKWMSSTTMKQPQLVCCGRVFRFTQLWWTEDMGGACYRQIHAAAATVK